jgi:hypothetical protein
MQYKTNRSNHDFQIAYFLAGSCHTPDAAYALMCDLREDRDNAIKMYSASKLREDAKVIRANRLIASDDEAVRLEGQADLVEIEAMAATVERNLNAAKAERATIDKCMALLEPLRIYAHLSLPEAHEAAQSEEWKLELIQRAENFILTTGSIPTDHFATMRMHPEFKTAILPAMNTIQGLMKEGKIDVLLEGNLTAPKFTLPQLLMSYTPSNATLLAN